MHYSVLCIIDKPEEGDTIDDAVKEAMEAHGDGKEWDWFQIGGRWTGHFDGYKPEDDPANIQTCDICNGTGTRPGGLEQFGEAWVKGCNGCNGCQGKKTRTKWPTDWARHPGDVIPVASLTDEHVKVHAICDGSWQSCEAYRPFGKTINDKFVKLPMPSAADLREQFPDSLAVIVDIHN